MNPYSFKIAACKHSFFSFLILFTELISSSLSSPNQPYVSSHQNRKQLKEVEAQKKRWWTSLSAGCKPHSCELSVHNTPQFYPHPPLSHATVFTQQLPRRSARHNIVKMHLDLNVGCNMQPHVIVNTIVPMWKPSTTNIPIINFLCSEYRKNTIKSIIFF